MNKNGVAKLLLLGLTIVVVLTSCISNTKNSSKSESFRFVQICDPQLGFSDYARDVNSFKQAVKQINAMKPDFVVICGDLVNTADDQSFADFNKIKSGLRMPCYCASGNHDIGNQPTPESLQYYRNVIGKDYFSFEYKGAWFVFVNTQLWKEPLQGESEKHDTWFRETLKVASEKGGPIFVVGHYPLFIKEPDEADEYMNLPVEKRRELLDLFEQYNVVATLGGHTHRLILNDYKGIQLVNGEPVGRSFDEHPLGFRVWRVQDNSPPKHRFVPLEDL